MCNSHGSVEKLLSACMGRVKNQPKTVGQQAEINMKKLGKERYEMMMEERVKKSSKPFTGKLGEGMKIRDESNHEIPWWRSGEVEGLPKEEKPININEIKDVEKYIVTGEK